MGRSVPNWCKRQTSTLKCAPWFRSEVTSYPGYVDRSIECQAEDNHARVLRVAMVVCCLPTVYSRGRSSVRSFSPAVPVTE